MLANLIGKFLANRVRSNLNGYHTIIGGAIFAVYALTVLAGLIWPEYNFSGSNADYAEVLKMFQDAAGLIGGGVASVGVLGKAYKAGIDMPQQALIMSETKGAYPIRDPLNAEK